jgi:ribosomal protein S27E
MLHINKKELDHSYPKVYVENCKNTKTDNSWKQIKCICGSTRIEAKIIVKGEGTGNWLHVRCKRCGNPLYYNGA